MSHSASKIRLHVTNFFSFILLLPTLTTACECPSDFPVCWANEVPRRCHVDSAVLSPLSNGNGCGGLLLFKFVKLAGWHFIGGTTPGLRVAPS